MGIWPEFKKCCWFVPLKIGTIFIGIITAVGNGFSTAFHVSILGYHILGSPENENTLSLFGFFVETTFLLVSLFGTILGIIIIIGRNKAKYLKKAVFGMTTLSLLNLLATILTVTNDDTYEVYFRAVNMLMSAYFILIIRSAQLELQGRHDNPPTRRHRRQIPCEHEVVIRTQPFPPPPAYDEACRGRNVYRCELTLTLPPTDEEATDVTATEQIGIAVLPVEQTTVNPGTPQDVKDTPMIFDMEQFNAVRNMQVVERNQESTSSAPSSTAL